jgi:hypothetical protein
MNIIYRKTENTMRATTSNRIVGIARTLRLAAWFGAAACVAVTVLAVLAPADASAPVAAVLSSDGLPRTWAATIVLTLAAVSAAALVELARMLGRVQAQALFPAAAIRHFRRFAGLLALAAVLRVGLPVAAVLVEAWRSGEHAARLVFDGGDLLALLPAAVFFLVARLLDEAARLEDDNRSIV